MATPAIGHRRIVITLSCCLDGAMTESVPLRPGDELTVRAPSAAERTSMNLAEDEPLLQIRRQDGAVETYGSFHVTLVPLPSAVQPTDPAT